MKKTAFISLFILVLTVAGFSQKSAGAKVDPAKDVRAAFDRLIDGIKQVDADKVMAAYNKSPDLLIHNNNGTSTRGWDTIKSNVEATFSHVKNVTLETTGIKVEMLGKTAAYVSCKWQQTQEYDGKLEDSSGRMTLVFQLIGKDWKIIHRHTSPENPGATRPVFPSERQD
ncbi:MAG: nuclear transport factor 2 family protein [Pyrinomonadaceae bacterium]